jgi:uncharacterized membrane protein
MYYAKQGLLIFIVAVILEIVGLVIGWIPIIGGIITGVLGFLLFIIWLIGWINALSGKKKPLFLLGNIAESFKF